MSSSHYSDTSENEEPILTLQPAPLRASPPLAASAEAAPIGRLEPGTTRQPLMLRKGPRRPTLDEYGVSSSQLSTSARHREPVPADGCLSPLSRSNTPQFHRPQRCLSPASILEHPSPREPPITGAIIDAGFQFDFGPSVAAPHTPDSAIGPLPSSAGLETEPDTDRELSLSDEPEPSKLNRVNAPPSLTFNFSPDVCSRDPSLLTPPLRSLSQKVASNDGQPRAPGDHLTPDDAAAAAAALGIGMARGPSIRRPPGQKMVDSFGTGFI